MNCLLKKLLTFSLGLCIMFHHTLWANEGDLGKFLNKGIEGFVNNYNSSRTSIESISIALSGNSVKDSKEISNYLISNKISIKDFPEIKYKDGKILIPYKDSKIAVSIVSTDSKKVILSINGKKHTINLADSFQEKIDSFKSFDLEKFSIIDLFVSKANASQGQGATFATAVWFIIIGFASALVGSVSTVAAGGVVASIGALLWVAVAFGDDLYKKFFGDDFDEKYKECGMNISKKDHKALSRLSVDDAMKINLEIENDCKKDNPSHGAEFCLEYFRVKKCVSNLVTKENGHAIDDTAREYTKPRTEPALKNNGSGTNAVQK